MTRKAGTIEEYRFELADLSASSAGLFDLYSTHSINGTIESITFLNNSFAAAGSLLIFPSGLQNSGTNTGGLVIRTRAGSTNTTIYPRTYTYDNQFVIGSGTSDSAREKIVVNEPIRLVGSGLGNGTSGIGVIIRYV